MPETPNRREVNADAETIDADAIPDDETTEDELDEEVIAPVEEEEEDAPATETEEEPAEEPADKTEEEPAESSPEGTEDEQPEEAPAPAPSQKKPAPVEGETPREKALRLEVQRVKGLLRKQGISDLIGDKGGDKQQPKTVSDRLAKLRETYSEEEIRNMEEAIDVLAESKGYVKAEQSYQQTVNAVVETFIEENPEFKPENDPEDVRWGRFQEILKSGLYNLSGKTSKQLAVIFKKVKADVDSELGDPAPVAKKKVSATDERKAAAAKQKIKSVSHSGGTKAAPAKPAATAPKKVDPIFKGFDPEDFEE